MKKVIIALLVVASLFAFVSCKDEVTYDKWAKMEFLDTEEGEGEIFDKALKLFDDLDDFKLTSSKLTATISDDEAEIDAIVVKTYDSDTEHYSYEFNGTYVGEQLKSFKVVADKDDNIISSTDATTASELLGIISDSSVEAELSETWEAEYEEGSEEEVGNSKISAIKVTVSGAGYNTKYFSGCPSALYDLYSLDSFATDFSFEITYDNKTLKAKLSSIVMGSSNLNTVTLNGKTYAYYFIPA